MVTVSDLEMAVNATYASILNEIQLSNLNFSIQITPFAAYITLKKSAQKDLNGHHVPPSPPLLVLVQNVQQENLNLREKNYTLKSAFESLEKNYNHIMMDNASMADRIEEANRTIDALTKNNEDLNCKIDIADQEAEKYSLEKAGLESKIKEMKKRNVEQVRDLENQVADFNKSFKTKDKLIYDLNTKLQNSRDNLSNCKSEKSALKTNKTKLEATVRKLEKQIEKKKKSDISDTNGNYAVISKSKDVKPLSTQGLSNNSKLNPLSLVSLSMVSHWNPNLTTPFQNHSSISSMIAHSAPKEKLITREDFLALMAEFREQMRSDRLKMLSEIKKLSLFAPMS